MTGQKIGARQTERFVLFSAFTVLCIIGMLFGVLYFSRFYEKDALNSVSLELLQNRIFILNLSVSAVASIACFSYLAALTLPTAVFSFSFFNAYALCCFCIVGQNEKNLPIFCALVVLCELFLAACALCGVDTVSRSYSVKGKTTFRRTIGRCFLIAALFSTIVFYHFLNASRF